MTNIDTWTDSTDGFDNDVLIDDAYFGFNEKMGVNPLLILECDPLDGQGETRSQFFSFGSAFEVVDNGARIVHKSGTPKPLPKGSNLFKLITSAMEIPELAAVLRSRGDAMTADVWKGLAVTMNRREIDREIRGAESGSKRQLTTITAFYPDKSRGLDAATTGNTQPAVEIGSWGIPLDTEQALKALTTSTSSHGEFNERALAEVDGVHGNAQAEALVGDPAFYEEIKG